MPEVNEGSVVDGRYRVLRRLGSGGMADVWLAEDTHLQRQVALKVLHRRFAQDREFVERFRREAESAAGLQHPNIVSVYRPRRVRGHLLHRHAVRRGADAEAADRPRPDAAEQAVALIRQVLEAARFAHRNGIVHRDLKPQNVIVDAEGKAVVTDFGIARAGVSEITQTGSVMGTPHYLSPEQAQGFDVTSVSDLYSIGVILYEALTGRVPFEGESAVAVAMKQVSQTPQRPSSINPRVSPALDAVVMRALEKDPGQRFQSADAFIAALDAAMKEPGAGAGDAPPSRRCRRWSRCRSRQEEDEDEERKRRRRWIWPPLAAAVLIGAPDRPGADPRHQHRSPERDRASSSNVRDRPARTATASRSARSKQVERQVAGEHGARAGPAASPPDEAEEDCSFLTFFCSKPAVTLTVSAGPGQQRRSPAPPGSARKRRPKSWKRPASKSTSKTVNSDSVEEGPGGPLRTLGRQHRDQRLDGDALRLQRPEAGQGAGPGRHPARRRGAADPRPRPRAVGLRRRKLRAGGRGDQPVAERRQRGRSRARPSRSSSPRAKKQAKVPNVIGKLRARSGGSGPRRRARPRRSKKKKPKSAAKSAARSTSSRRPGTELEPGAEVTIVVGKRAGRRQPERAEEEAEP